jgi:hypothetical protein
MTDVEARAKLEEFDKIKDQIDADAVIPRKGIVKKYEPEGLQEAQPIYDV